MQPSLTAIAAVGANGVIGDGSRLLWHIPEDFARFKKLTMGGVLVMGRRTYESLGKGLPGRVCVVMTRRGDWSPRADHTGDVVVTDSVAGVARILAGYPDRRWWSSGGGEVYRALWGYTTDLELTWVDATPDGSVTFPDIGDDWRETGREDRTGFDFVTYERRDSRAAEALGSLVGHAG